MSKSLLQLKVVGAAGQNVPASRLCDLCANSAILRGWVRPANGAPEAGSIEKEEVICLFLGRVIEIDVTECNRFADRFPPSPEGAMAAGIPISAWVA
jgi:hypothetical protein